MSQRTAAVAEFALQHCSAEQPVLVMQPFSWLRRRHAGFSVLAVRLRTFVAQFLVVSRDRAQLPRVPAFVPHAWLLLEMLRQQQQRQEWAFDDVQTFQRSRYDDADGLLSIRLSRSCSVEISGLYEPSQTC